MNTTKYPLLSQNSSGQGQFPNIQEHPLTAIVQRFGYTYSHSTNVGSFDGTGFNLYHTFEHPSEMEHKVSFYDHDHHMLRIETSVSPANGRKHSVCGIAPIKKHLSYKAKKYSLAIPTIPQ